MYRTILKLIAPGEAGEVESMARRIWPEAYKGVISKEQIDYMLGWMYAPDKIAREISEEGIQYFWIAEDDENDGFLSVGPVLPGKMAFLQKLYILNEKHGKGLGTRALASLFEILPKAGVPMVELRVNRDNSSAISFYRKNGFETVAEDKAGIGRGFAMDDYIMRRAL